MLLNKSYIKLFFISEWLFSPQEHGNAVNLESQSHRMKFLHHSAYFKAFAFTDRSKKKKILFWRETGGWEE